MNDRFPETPARLNLMLTGEHCCSYLPERRARTLFVDPAQPITAAIYQQLTDKGFRRSGAHLYRPHCDACDACVPIRLPVREFRPRRAQRRCQARNRDVRVTERPPQLADEHYRLFMQYLDARHPDGGMAGSSAQSCLEFLTCSWADTRFLEFRRDGRLMALAVIDMLPRGLSAVYTVFDQTYAAASPGVFAVLWQIQRARSLGLEWLYLGYWIRDCSKMNYKARYRPLEAWTQSGWTRYGDGLDLPA